MHPPSNKAHTTQPTRPAVRKNVWTALRLVLLLAFVAIPALGCSSGIKGVKISGKVIPPDNMKLGENDTLQVSLTSVEDTKLGDGANVAKDMTFKLIGPEKKGVPPGKYKVKVTPAIYMKSSEHEKQEKELKEQLKAFTGDLEVGTSDMSIVIDLKKKTVTKE